MENVYDVLNFMQKEIKVPKKHYNKFSNFHYRKCEDIFEEVKKITPPGACLIMDDQVFVCGKRVYIRAIASLNYKGQKVSSEAYAREPLDKVKFDVAQITGSSSTYARKYALNGLFLLDDCEDSDAQNNGHEESKSKYNPRLSGDPNILCSSDKVSEEGLQRILFLMSKLNISIETKKKWYSHFKVKTLEELNVKDARAILTKLNAMAEKI